MALQLAIAVASGGYFLGKAVDQAEVLYLAFEDPGRRLKARVKQIGVERDAPITFMTEFRPLDGDGLNDLYIHVSSGRYKLVVVDTFGRSLTAGKLEIKDYSDNVAVLSPLQKMAQKYAVTILLVDHHSKINGDNPITDLIGSIGKSATFDCVIGIYREQGKQGAKLMIVGRDDDVDLATNRSGTGKATLGESVYQANVLMRSNTCRSKRACDDKSNAEYITTTGNVVALLENCLLIEIKTTKSGSYSLMKPYKLDNIDNITYIDNIDNIDIIEGITGLTIIIIIILQGL